MTFLNDIGFDPQHYKLALQQQASRQFNNYKKKAIKAKTTMNKIRKKVQRGDGKFKGVNRQTSKTNKQKGGYYRVNKKNYRRRKQKGGGFGIGMAAGMALPLLTSFLGKNKKLGFGGQQAPPPPPPPPPQYYPQHYYRPPPQHYPPTRGYQYPPPLKSKK